MLELNPETVCFIIGGAKKFQAKESSVRSEDPVGFTGDERSPRPLADHADDLCYSEVKSVIDDLEPDQQVALIALMLIGRGDYGNDEWDAAYAEASADWTPRTAEYLLSTPLVADYLEEGLTSFGYGCDQ